MLKWSFVTFEFPTVNLSHAYYGAMIGLNELFVMNKCREASEPDDVELCSPDLAANHTLLMHASTSDYMTLLQPGKTKLL